MNDANILDIPPSYTAIKNQTAAIGFTMPSDLYVGTLLKTLATSKTGGRFLELGTGTGLSLAWLVNGMDEAARIISVDNNPEVLKIASQAFDNDERVTTVCADGEQWLSQYQGDMFDLIFADAWPGKYSVIEKTLNLLKIGGFYVIDDMQPQPNWPEGHQEKASRLIAYLEERDDLHLSKLNWSTGLIIVAKTNKESFSIKLRQK